MIKKIALLVPDLALGGGQRVALNTAQLLAERYDVTLVIFTDDEKLFNTDIRVINLKCTKKSSVLGKIQTIYKRVKRYKKLLKKEKFDITISFLESANLCAFLSDRKNSILTQHTKPELLARFDQIVLQYLFRFSHHIIAVSAGLKDTLETSLKLKHVSVINNPIDIPEVQALANIDNAAINAKQPKRKFIVAVGRLVEVKRYDLMMDVFCKTTASNDYDLVIIGDGEDYNKLQKHIEHLPAACADKIHLIGGMENPFPIIKEAELILLTSRIEAFPMVLLEALALEVPIVSYNCPAGLKDIVLNNQNGLLIENNDFDGLVNAIDKVLSNHELRQTLKNNTLKSVQRFSPESILNNWEKYFRRA